MEPSRPPTMSQEQMEKILWFFRTEDPSAWNYSILALSIVGLILGLLILGRNITANRKRKLAKECASASVDMTLPATQALLMLTEGGGPKKQDPQLDAGTIMVQWKDGNITSLYREGSDEDV